MSRPLLLGHRGARASSHIPENTLESFELCLQHGCAGFEFDVRLSSDGIAVICHDPVLHGLDIEKTPASRLELPALNDVLREFSSRAFLDIELKVSGVEALALSALHEHPPQKGYVVSSFLPEVLYALHALDRNVPLGFLCERSGQLRGWRDSPAEWVIPHLKLADQELINQVHAAGRRVMVWTVNHAQQIRRLAERGADALISDDTELLVRSFSGAMERDI